MIDYNKTAGALMDLYDPYLYAYESDEDMARARKNIAAALAASGVTIPDEIDTAAAVKLISDALLSAGYTVHLDMPGAGFYLSQVTAYDAEAPVNHFELPEPWSDVCALLEGLTTE